MDEGLQWEHMEAWWVLWVHLITILLCLLNHFSITEVLLRKLLLLSYPNTGIFVSYWTIQKGVRSLILTSVQL